MAVYISDATQSLFYTSVCVYGNMQRWYRYIGESENIILRDVMNIELRGSKRTRKAKAKAGQGKGDILKSESYT